MRKDSKIEPVARTSLVLDSMSSQPRRKHPLMASEAHRESMSRTAERQDRVNMLSKGLLEKKARARPWALNFMISRRNKRLGLASMR